MFSGIRFLSILVNNLNGIVAMLFFEAFMPYKEKYRKHRFLIIGIFYCFIVILNRLRFFPVLNEPLPFYCITASYFLFQIVLMLIVFEAPVWEKIFLFTINKAVESVTMALTMALANYFTPDFQEMLNERGFFTSLRNILYLLVAQLLGVAICLLIVKISRIIKNHRFASAGIWAYVLIPISQVSLFIAQLSYFSERLRLSDVLELNDIIRLTGFSKSGVLNWLLHGDLPSIRSGRFYLVPKRYLLDFLCSPYYRTIKNKSPKQKADMAEIERVYCLAVKAGGGDE